MIQNSETDLLRSAAGQFSATQFIQDQLRALGGGNQLQVPPANDSSEVNLSDASKLLSVLGAGDGGSESLLSALSALVERLTGQEVASLSLDSQKLEASYVSLDTVEEALRVGRGGSSLDYRYNAVHADAQTLSYSAQGKITLENGTELSFDFQLEASRIYVEETRARVQINGSQLRDALGANIPGLSARPREGGLDIDFDHHGVRQLLQGLEDGPQRRGQHGRDDDEQHAHARVDEAHSNRENTQSGAHWM